MSRNAPPSGRIMRLFDVRPKPGAMPELLAKFATVSADVVDGEPGNLGYVFGQAIAAESDRVIFASMWTDMEAVKARFGANWADSLLPEGYEALIDSCSVTHFDLSVGWHVKMEA